MRAVRKMKRTTAMAIAAVVLIILVVVWLYEFQPQSHLASGQPCGGVAGFKCPEGYTCELKSIPPISDAFGKCVPQDDSVPKNDSGQPCGGVAGFKCPEGYTCKVPSVPPISDAFGKCVPQK